MTEKHNRFVEPFNEVYTHDCFINALLCVAKHYQLDYPMLTLHENFIYVFHGERLNGRRVTLVPIEELALAIGLCVYREKDGIKNWREEYKTQFERGKVIITSVNDYYNPLRIDAYKRKCVPHYVLVYDMDDKKELLSLIESRYRATVLYKNLKMRYNDFEKSHFQSEQSYIYICQKTKRKKKLPYQKEYLHSSISLTDQSISNLEHYIQYLSNHDIVDKGTWLKDLDDICNQMKVEQYVFKQFFLNDDLTGIVTDIYQTWYLLRARAVKLFIMKRDDNMSLNVIDYLNKIKKLEKDKLDVLSTLRIPDG